MRDLLARSRAGRLFLAASAVKLVLAVVRRAVPLPAPLELVGHVATIALVASVGYFVWRLFVLMKRRLLWRVRRKLILSYIFMGVVPALLILTFFMLGAWVVSTNISTYMFRTGYDELVAQARLAATVAASDIARAPGEAAEPLARAWRTSAGAYPRLSLAFVPAGAARDTAPAGPWAHAHQPPARVPPWLFPDPNGFAGTVFFGSGADVTLVVRAVAPVVTETRLAGHVIADLPVDRDILDRLYVRTGVRADAVRLGGTERATMSPAAAGTPAGPDAGDRIGLFGRWVTILETRDWTTGEVRPASISNTYSVRELYEKLAGAQPVRLGEITYGQAILTTLIVVASLFLIIQFVALVMGLALARSITSSVHELFMGTERVRHGDFAHRIAVRSNDQLGELAASFNQMIGSIENLLQTAAEKKRLEEELRIARQIQMSLLPRGALDVPGLAVTALCVPAREVGGDYYDFFHLPDGRLGVLIADVSGKGTSAALYMAELKGVMLSLSQIYLSPRQLLLEVNRIISDNLDSRSFITMTYAVLDLQAGTMRHARAGHTPLMYLKHGAAERRVQVLAPDGLVVGLQIPGAAEKFAELLQEDFVELGEGDVIALYTDGITEAMDDSAEMFGEARLGRLIEEHGHLESGELRERILREIESFVGGADQHDDMTMVLLKIERVAAGHPAV
jgi:phosphoserine phosphatase RsbU/P